jgi:hypothetical protein
MSDRPLCRHCQVNLARRNNSRMLCYGCMNDVAIRERYPGAPSKYTRQGHGTTEATVDPEPTEAYPGTPEKEAALTARAAAGQRLYHTHDAGDTAGTTEPMAMKLTPEDMTRAAGLLRSGWKLKAVAAQFGVAENTIGYHLRFVLWEIRDAARCECGARLRRGCVGGMCRHCRSASKCLICEQLVCSAEDRRTCPDCRRAQGFIAEAHGGDRSVSHPVIAARVRVYTERAAKGLPLFERMPDPMLEVG